MTTPMSTTGAKPIGFTDYIWAKCKSQPLIPIGIVATCFALGGATWNLRTGNRQRFNHYLRLRVIAQGATVVAMVAYGSVAITREQQQAHYIKTQKTLGDLPADTIVPEASGRIGRATPDFDSRRPTLSQSSSISDSTSMGASPSAGSGSDAEEDTEQAYAYPLAKKDRMRASDFAKRLREAERITAREDEEARGRGSQ